MKGFIRGMFIVMSVLMIMWSFTAMNVQATDVYPSKPIIIIIAFPPGASLDFTARGLAPYMSKYLGTNIMISNLPGAAGDIGHYKAYTAKPDGYTLLLWNMMGPLLSEYAHEVRFKTLKFTPIAAISRDYHILLGHPEGINNITDFIKQAKTRGVSIGNNGQFTVNGFQGRLMAKDLGLKVKWVNYSGGAEAITALAGKHLDASTNTCAVAVPLVKANKVAPLLIFAEHRVPYLPDVPVPSELGLDFPLLGGSTIGIVVPPGLDKEKVKLLESAIMKTTKNPNFIAWMEKASTADRIFFSADAYAKELERLGKIAAKYKDSFAN